MDEIKNSQILKTVVHYLDSRNLNSVEKIKESIITKPDKRSGKSVITIPICDDTNHTTLKREQNKLLKYQSFVINSKGGMTSSFIFDEITIDSKELTMILSDQQISNLSDMIIEFAANKS